MKSLLPSIALAFAFTLPSATASADDYAGSRFSEVWSAVQSDPYDELPSYRVTVASFFSGFRNKLLESSRRTLGDARDLLPRFRKLLHPSGVCLAGTWNITEDTPYTGYFRAGSEGLIIVRASTALTATDRGEYRVFAIAGKIYPTDDPNHAEPLKTANFVTIEDLGGTLRQHFLDARVSNDIINITIRPSSVFQGPLAITVAHAFATADHTIDVTQTLIRQLYPIAELGEPEDALTLAPRWLELRASMDTPRVTRDDFRDELNIANYPDGIVLDIYVADEGTRIGSKEWQRIGYIHLTDSAASDTCDRRLHFRHPPFHR